MGGRMMHSSSIVARTNTREAGKPGQIYELTDMDVEEVSLVDRAANKRRFLVVKRSDQMAIEVRPDGKGGFTSREGAGKGGAKTPAKKALEVPPGFKEMVGPLLNKASEMLSSLSDDLAASKAADVGDDGTIPGVPAEFTSTVQTIMGLLDKAGSLYPTATPEAEAPVEGEEDPSLDPEMTEMQMRLALDNVGQVLGTQKLAKSAILKVGAKMSKDRLTRLQQAAQVITNLIAELAPTPPSAATLDDKTSKNETTSLPNPLAQQIGQLIDQVSKLAGVVKSQQADLATLKKARGAPSASMVETSEPNVPAAKDFSWPLDMNNPITRETVGKSESFFDD